MSDSFRASNSYQWSRDFYTLLLLFANLNYALVKKPFSCSIPQMIVKLGLTKKDIGEFSASFTFLYALFKLVGGVLTDMLSGHLLFSGGLFLGGLINLIIPFFSDIPTLRSLWAMNGLLQGSGGPALSKIAIVYFPSNCRSSTWSFLNTANNIGYLIAPYLLYYALTQLGWQGPFWIAGTLALVSAIPLLGFQTFFPKASCPNNNHYLFEQSSDLNTSANKKPVISTTDSDQTITFFGVMGIFLLIVSNALVYFIMKSISDWTIQYLMEKRHLSNPEALALVFWGDLGSFIGAHFIGILADYWSQSKTMICLICAMLFSICVYITLLLEILTVSDACILPTLPLTSSAYYLHQALFTFFEFHCQFLFPYKEILTQYLLLGSFDYLIWSSVYFIGAIALNGPQAILFLFAVEESLKVISPRIKWLQAGTIGGVIGLLTHFGSSGSGLIMGQFLMLSWAYFNFLLFVASGLLIVALLFAWFSFYLSSFSKSKQIKLD